MKAMMKVCVLISFALMLGGSVAVAVDAKQIESKKAENDDNDDNTMDLVEIGILYQQDGSDFEQAWKSVVLTTLKAVNDFNQRNSEILEFSDYKELTDCDVELEPVLFNISKDCNVEKLNKRIQNANVDLLVGPQCENDGIAQLSNIQNLTFISYEESAPFYNDYDEFPNLFRVVPNFTKFFNLLLKFYQMLRHQDQVAVLYAENPLGFAFWKELQVVARRYNIHFKAASYDPTDVESLQTALRKIKKTNLHSILSFVDNQDFPILVEQAKALGMLQKEYLWMLSPTVSIKMMLRHGKLLSEAGSVLRTNFAESFFRNFSEKKNKDKNKKKANSGWEKLAKWWEDVPPSEVDKLVGIKNFETNWYLDHIASFAYDAVIASGLALCRSRSSPGEQILKEISFDGTSGKVDFDEMAAPEHSPRGREPIIQELKYTNEAQVVQAARFVESKWELKRLGNFINQKKKTKSKPDRNHDPSSRCWKTYLDSKSPRYNGIVARKLDVCPRGLELKVNNIGDSDFIASDKPFSLDVEIVIGTPQCPTSVEDCLTSMLQGQPSKLPFIRLHTCKGDVATCVPFENVQENLNGNSYENLSETALSTKYFLHDASVINQRVNRRALKVDTHVFHQQMNDIQINKNGPTTLIVHARVFTSDGEQVQWDIIKTIKINLNKGEPKNQDKNNFLENGKEQKQAREIQLENKKNDETGPEEQEAVLEDLRHISMPVRYLSLVMLFSIWALCFLLTIWTFLYRNHIVTKSSQKRFLALILLGVSITSSTILFMLIEDSHEDRASGSGGNKWATAGCRATIWSYCLGFSILFAPLFAKLEKTSEIYNGQPLHRVHVGYKRIFKSFAWLIGVDLLLLVIWHIRSPMIYKREDLRVNIDQVVLSSAGQCESPSSSIYLGIMFVHHFYQGIRAAMYSFRTANFATAYSENRFNSILSLSGMQVLGVLMPILLMSGENATSRIFVSSCVISMTCFYVLFLVFIPKLVVIHTSKKSMLRATLMIDETREAKVSPRNYHAPNFDKTTQHEIKIPNLNIRTIGADFSLDEIEFK